ncbi:MAG: hypothetical protein OEY13_16965 [Gammaproteobacteria bacterium]|nr:hypothetical protein [Gammaproteobacteria bacterium]MDH5274752.1 hypothetical protein [Gammaproteobacteria bacterium]
MAAKLFVGFVVLIFWQSTQVDAAHAATLSPGIAASKAATFSSIRPYKTNTYVVYLILY